MLGGRQPRQIVLNKVDNDVVANALIEFAVQLGEACAQHIIAAKQDVKRLPKGIDIELALAGCVLVYQAPVYLGT